jgi:hypothetical protein
MSKDFLKEIEVPGILEILGERWDNALELMDRESLVYGGAIRDIIAGLPLKGDLDIVGDPDSYSRMVYYFTNSAKWTPEGWVPPVASHDTKAYHSRVTATLPIMNRNKSKYLEQMSVDSTTSFFTFDNAKVQLVRTRPVSLSGFKAALQVAKEVDIICCGLVMDRNGRVFEIVEGAYDDCVNKILRFNKISRLLNLDNLQARITKLKERGWASKISIARLRKQKEKADKAERSEKERLTRTKKKKSPKDMQQVRPWLSVSSANTELSNQEIFLDLDKLRNGIEHNLSLGYIKDVIRVTANEMDLEHKRTYDYRISHKGILRITVGLNHTRATDFAIVMADRLEGYSGESPSRSTKKKVVWQKTGKNKTFTTTTSRASKRDMRDVEAPLTKRDIDTAIEPASDEGHMVHTHGEATISVSATDPEILTFRAIMDEDGQIQINSDPEEFGEDIANYGSVEIDISNIPEEAQERVKQAFSKSRQDYQRRGITNPMTTRSSSSSSNEVGKPAKMSQAVYVGKKQHKYR